MDTFAQAVEKIIHEQENIIGPLAREQAKKVKGLKFNGSDIALEGNRATILEDLVGQYSHIFGKASIEVCKEAMKPFLSQLPPGEVPSLLR